MCFDEFVRIAKIQRARVPESSAAPAPARRNADDFESRPCCTHQPSNFPGEAEPPHRVRARFADRLNQLASSVHTAKYRRHGAPALRSADMLQTNVCPRTFVAGHCW